MPHLLGTSIPTGTFESVEVPLERLPTSQVIGLDGSRSLEDGIVIAGQRYACELEVSMVLSMAAAGVAGAMVPMVLTRLRQDPAQSSSIILKTITNVAGFLSFLGIATLLSGML